MSLTASQRTLLEAISRHDGEWNDYKLGRACLAQLESPADFNLRPLLDAEYIEERRFEGEPLPRLYLTDRGKVALQA